MSVESFLGIRADVPAQLRTFSSTEAAEMLGVSLRTIERIIAAREIAVIRVGRRVRISEGALVAYLEAHGA